MKKIKQMAYVGAIALLSMSVFTACSSSDDAVAGEGPNPQVPGETVKTQFSISLPSEISAMRMAGSTVQEAGTLASFRGMSDIVLIPYLHATSRTSRLGANITFTSMIKPNTAVVSNSIPAGNLLQGSTAVLYNDVTIPVGTSGFLFYGKATGEDGYANGALTPAGLDGESSGISFSLNPIKPTPDLTKGEALAVYVTSIAQASDNTDPNDVASWAGCADNTNSTKAWYSAGLGALYSNFITLKAGGSSYVQAAVQDLYTSLKNNTDKVSVAIKNAITNPTYASVDGEGKLTFTADISNYPQEDNNSMPEGAAAFTWTGNTATAVSTAQVSTLNLQDMSKIVYPASLYYFVDSDLKTSNASRKDDYTDTDTWTTILGKYTSGTSVVAATRSVAITKQIQYAVGRLDVTVKGLTNEKYYDRRGDEVTIPAVGYTLTGVLIGGQKVVDYKFEPKGTEEFTIYDKTINTAGTAKDAVTKNQDAGTNYTLALETPATDKVNIALEFINNGDDFMGVDGVVKKGCKFYMVAQLDPAIDTENKTGKKVFKQDFKTIANFTFGAGTADTNHDGESDTPGGFGNAYTTIPDLRTPKLELGFSVDLTWQEGLTFNHTF